MKDVLKRFAKSSIVLSIILIILAILLIFKPDESLNFMVIIIGIVLAVLGVMHMISYFSSPKEFKSLSFELIEGIIGITAGILLIIKPSLIKEFLATLVGSWMIIQSIVRLQLAFNLKALNSRNWIYMLILSITTLILGIIIIFNPFATVVAVTTISGIMLLISEIVSLIEAIELLKM